MTSNWTTSDIPNLESKIAIVTGGNIGLGYKSSLELAKKGAIVVIACRSEDKGSKAIESIKKQVPNATCDVIPLDLLDKDSIKQFSETFNDRYKQLSILLLNAGVVNLENLQRSTDGTEIHMATNHLGHFALTGRLFKVLKDTDNSRVVTISSLAYKSGVIDFDDFTWEKRKYDRFKAYGDSKLANLLFMAQLQKLFDSVGSSAISVAAHPGLTGTERQQSIGIGGVIARCIASPVSKGCLPQLLAATETNVKACEFYGPRYGLVGPPRLQKVKSELLNGDLSKRLWSFSEELTGVKYGEE